MHAAGISITGTGEEPGRNLAEPTCRFPILGRHLSRAVVQGGDEGSIAVCSLGQTPRILRASAVTSVTNSYCRRGPPPCNGGDRM